MTQAEAKAKIAELEEDYEEMKETAEDAQAELAARPSVEIEIYKEVVVENFNMSEAAHGALFAAMAKCQSEFEAVAKTSKAHGYDYADIKAVLEATSEVTSKNGIAIVQMNVSKIIGKTVFVGVKTILGHKDGGWISSEVYIPAIRTKKNTVIQMAGVNITYLRRYGIQSALGLATTDSDGAEK